MSSTGHVARALAAAFVASLSLSPSGAEAGLFDEIGRLFGGGGGPQPSAAPSMRAPRIGRSPHDAPLQVTVRPRSQQRRKGAGRVRLRAVAEAKKPKEVVRIDTDKNPDWYLEDATLRLGDIVVLKGEVLVFQGGSVPYSRENFAALKDSRLPVAEKRKVRDMAGLTKESPAIDPAAARAVATVSQ